MLEISSRISGVKPQPVTPEIILDLELQQGPYADKGMNLKQLLDNPHGVDLGPLKSCLSERILTANGKIQLTPQLYLDDIPRLKGQLKQTSSKENFPFELISRRLVRSHNTWTQNSYRLVKGKNPCTLELNPKDAKALSIIDGQVVLVTSETGRVEVEVNVTANIRPGVVSLPQGWGHNQKDTSMTTAAKQPGVSINDLTNSNRIDNLTGNAAFNGTRVAISVI